MATFVTRLPGNSVAKTATFVCTTRAGRRQLRRVKTTGVIAFHGFKEAMYLALSETIRYRATKCGDVIATSNSDDTNM